MSSVKKTGSNDNLFFATLRGDTSAIKGHIQNGARVNETMDERELVKKTVLFGMCKATPLHFAAKYGQNAALEILVDANADVNSTESRTYTPLHFAAIGGHDACIRHLLNANAEVDAKDNLYNSTPLHLAAKHGKDACVRLLLDANAEVNSRSTGQETPLHVAVAFHFATNKTIKLLLDNGANIDTQRSFKNKTPLHDAVIGGNLETTKALVEANATLDHKDEEGRTPLHDAVIQGDLEITKALVEALVKASATLDHKDDEGRTPLYEAMRQDESNASKSYIIDLLIKNNADSELATWEQKAPHLHIAAEAGSENAPGLIPFQPAQKSEIDRIDREDKVNAFVDSLSNKPRVSMSFLLVSATAAALALRTIWSISSCLEETPDEPQSYLQSWGITSAAPPTRSLEECAHRLWG